MTFNSYLNLKEFWEILLETRVKLQNVLSTVNQFPQLDTYETVLNSLKPEMKKNTQEILNESKPDLSLSYKLRN